MVSTSVFFIRRHRIDIDGKGVRTLIGLSNCPLHCRYCINPQCKRDSLGQKWNVKQLIDSICIDNLYFVATNGGVTFGGGEPGLHYEFISEFKNLCPKEWTISLETSLNYPIGVMQELDKCVDYYIIDIKEMNSDIYERYTGATNENVYRNLEFLQQHGRVKDVTIRIPLIPNYNNQDDVIRSKEIIEQMGFVNIDIFTYVENINKIYERTI